jgi:hypothetical protein
MFSIFIHYFTTSTYFNKQYLFSFFPKLNKFIKKERQRRKNLVWLSLQIYNKKIFKNSFKLMFVEKIKNLIYIISQLSNEE